MRKPKCQKRIIPVLYHDRNSLHPASFAQRKPRRINTGGSQPCNPPLGPRGLPPRRTSRPGRRDRPWRSARRLPPKAAAWPKLASETGRRPSERPAVRQPWTQHRKTWCTLPPSTPTRSRPRCPGPPPTQCKKGGHVPTRWSLHGTPPARSVLCPVSRRGGDGRRKEWRQESVQRFGRRGGHRAVGQLGFLTGRQFGGP
jgi:hypothetical protein